MKVIPETIMRTKFDIYVFIYSNKNVDIKFSAHCIFVE